MGRTGKMFAMEHWGVIPDLTTIAKSLAGGMPLSAVVGKTELMDSVHLSGLGGTYGANPICCSAALAVLNIFEEDKLLEKSALLGKKLEKYAGELKKKYELVGDVRGKGPMIAIELVQDRKTKEPATEITKSLVSYCRRNGLIILSCGNYANIIRLLMPLVINNDELDKGLSILEDGISFVSK
jgi:4-aminobutyrate aminotransferase/(S)-3-amino-2-methylpropionate transaminase